MLAVALLTPPVMLAAMVALGRYEERLLGAPPAGPARRPPAAPSRAGPPAARRARPTRGHRQGHPLPCTT